MTTQTISLKGEQWKQLALLSYTQLVTHLQGIPGNIENGDAGLTDEHLARIDAHLGEARLFLQSWRVARVIQPEPEKPEQIQPVANGEVRQKRKYTKRAKPEQSVTQN